MKHVHRFLVSIPVSAGDPVMLDEEDSFHAARVLRLRDGDAVELADSRGRVFMATVSSVTKKGALQVEVLPETEMDRPAVKGGLAITFAQAMPSGKKMDVIVEKLTELGANRIVPVMTQKCVLREARGWEERVERWRRIARAAAAQSKRADVPAVDAPFFLEDWLDIWYGPLLVLATEVESVPLGREIDRLLVEKIRSPAPGLAILTGPEAGFSEPELEMLREREALFVSLGPHILRTETAAIAAATLLMHRLAFSGDSQ